MTPAGKKAITAVTLAVAVAGALLVKGFFAIHSGPAGWRHHHAAETPESPVSFVERRLQPLWPAATETRDRPTAAPAPTLRTARTAAPAPAREDDSAEGGEFIFAERTAETIAAEHAIQSKLDGVIQRNPGSGVRFVDCTEQPCRARAEAKDLETLTAFLRDLSGSYDGHLAVDLRERLDPFMGRSFEADLRVGTKDTQPVPTEPLVSE